MSDNPFAFKNPFQARDPFAFQNPFTFKTPFDRAVSAPAPKQDVTYTRETTIEHGPAHPERLQAALDKANEPAPASDTLAKLKAQIAQEQGQRGNDQTR